MPSEKNVPNKKPALTRNNSTHINELYAIKVLHTKEKKKCNRNSFVVKTRIRTKYSIFIVLTKCTEKVAEPYLSKQKASTRHGTVHIIKQDLLVVLTSPAPSPPHLPRANQNHVKEKYFVIRTLA